MTYPILRTRPDGLGIDWDDVRAQREAQLALQAAEGVDDHETRAWIAQQNGQEAPEKPKPKRRAQEGFGGSDPRYDRRAIAEMYVKDRMTVDDIAQKIGAHRQTVRNNLKAAGVAMRDDRVGNPRGRMGRR